MIDAQHLKVGVDFRRLVEETHQVTQRSKTLCPFHNDHHPSLHVYVDGFFCFACGASGDHFDWLEQTQGLRFKEAAAYISRLRTARPRRPTAELPRAVKPLFKPVRAELCAGHNTAVKRLTQVPAALSQHGFTLSDCKTLGIAADGKDAVLAITGPGVRVLALKRRHYTPTPYRYSFDTPGHGAPAWCSPNMRQAGTLLIVEGELNGMMCWLTLRRDGIAVMGTAGAMATFHPQAVKGRTVYLYADDDAAGQRAVLRWARQAHAAGAAAVYWLEPWERDACEMVTRFGKQRLRKRLRWSMRNSLVFNAVAGTSAAAPAGTKAPSAPVHPGLMRSCSPSRPQLNPAGCHDVT